MEKAGIVSQLNQALSEVPELRRLSYSDGQFGRWKEMVLRTLEKAYGLDSPQYYRFVNAPGKSFVVNTELGLQQDYAFKLDCYESALQTLIQRAEMG
ncbi:MAG: hypothetical protein HYX84_03255 [Chloroflexi bacterium]|nr:hypothetical protein [Chloroflexota bacterium]